MKGWRSRLIRSTAPPKSSTGALIDATAAVETYPPGEFKMFVALSYARMNKARAAKYQWAKEHAALPIADRRGDELRVYFSSRDGQGRSQIGYFTADLQARNPVIAVSEVPIVSLGPRGAFDESGVTSSWIVNWNGRQYPPRIEARHRLDHAEALSDPLFTLFFEMAALAVLLYGRSGSPRWIAMTAFMAGMLNDVVRKIQPDPHTFTFSLPQFRILGFAVDRRCLPASACP